MEYRVFGATGLRISRIGFGGAPAGISKYLGSEDRDGTDFKEGIRTALREAIRRGITYFDVAPGYGGGRAETLYGEALEPHRESIVLATKYAFDASWTPEKASRELDESLDRLKTRRADILQYHGNSFSHELVERILASKVLDWAEEMKAKGRCRFTGITAEAPSAGLERLLLTGRFSTLLCAHNLIYQSWCDYQREPVGIIPLAKSLGMGIATMRPATSGFLQKLLPREFPGLDPARIARMAVKFVLSTPEVDCAVVGMRSTEEVSANADLADDATDRYDLKELHNRFD